MENGSIFPRILKIESQGKTITNKQRADVEEENCDPLVTETSKSNIKMIRLQKKNEIEDGRGQKGAPVRAAGQPSRF